MLSVKSLLLLLAAPAVHSAGKDGGWLETPADSGCWIEQSSGDTWGCGSKSKDGGDSGKDEGGAKSASCTSSTTATNPKKILCLHGGGGSANGMRISTCALESALPEYEFVFASIASDADTGETWWGDPPDKNTPTTDPNHAAAMVQALDAIREAQGPFHGILGYSQGSAAVPVYLSQTTMTEQFEMALMFCGYLPTTHTGLVNVIEAKKPFGDIPALVWMGVNDGTITNQMTTEQAAVFTNPTVVTSTSGGHAVPAASDSTFAEVLAFMGSGAASRSQSLSVIVLALAPALTLALLGA